MICDILVASRSLFSPCKRAARQAYACHFNMRSYFDISHRVKYV